MLHLRNVTWFSPAKYVNANLIVEDPVLKIYYYIELKTFGFWIPDIAARKFCK
jgi:hypothetical protein